VNPEYQQVVESICLRLIQSKASAIDVLELLTCFQAEGLSFSEMLDQIQALALKRVEGPWLKSWLDSAIDSDSAK